MEDVHVINIGSESIRVVRGGEKVEVTITWMDNYEYLSVELSLAQARELIQNLRKAVFQPAPEDE